jgi:uncharacterized protein (TIGR02145 family)
LNHDSEKTVIENSSQNINKTERSTKETKITNQENQKETKNSILGKGKLSSNLPFLSLITVVILVVIYIFVVDNDKKNNNKDFADDEMVHDENILAYKSTVIGGQTWMAEDLNVTTFRNGDQIPVANSTEDFEGYGNQQLPAMLIVNDKNLYNWFAVNDSRGLAPEGWRVAASNDWDNLLVKIEYSHTDLKSTTGWAEGQNGTDNYRFNAKPDQINDYCGFWWTSTEIEMENPQDSKIYANIAVLGSYGEDGCYILNPFKTMPLRVRCVKD